MGMGKTFSKLAGWGGDGDEENGEDSNGDTYLSHRNFLTCSNVRGNLYLH